jgi:Fic family protein
VSFWEEPQWPDFRWDAGQVLEPLSAARHKQGRLLGRMLQLGFELQQDAQVQALTEEVVKSSDIEGESLDRESVRSSVARRPGVSQAG